MGHVWNVEIGDGAPYGGADAAAPGERFLLTFGGSS
jgi:hypothetical protein